MARWQHRHELRTLYAEIIEGMTQWVIDSPDIAAFQAKGHSAYLHINPTQDLVYRMLHNGFTADEIIAAIENEEPPANWQSAEVLGPVVTRIQEMKVWFATHDPGLFAVALKVYGELGAKARKAFTRQHGYAGRFTHPKLSYHSCNE